MGFFSKLFGGKKPVRRPKISESSKSKSNVEDRPPKPERLFHNIPETIDMADFKLAGLMRIDLILVLAKLTDEKYGYLQDALIYEALVDDGVIQVPLVLKKDGNRFGIFAFYKEEEAANFKLFRKKLIEDKGFADCYYVSAFDPGKYELTDGRIETQTSFNALFRYEKDPKLEDVEGRYAMWWSTLEDPHFGSSKCNEYYREIYENMGKYGSVFMGMLAAQLFNKEMSRMSLPEEEKLLYTMGPENQYCILALSKEKGLRILMPRDKVDTIYRERLLKCVSKSMLFLGKGLKERNIPQDDSSENDGLAWYNMMEERIRNAQDIASSIAEITIGNPKIENENSDKIDPAKVVVRVKVGLDPDAPLKETKLDLPEEMNPIIVPYQEDVLLGLAIDAGHSYQYINNKMLDENEYSIEQLIEFGKNNVFAEIKENIKIAGNPEESNVMITCGGNHESALLLFDEFWDKIEDIFKSDVCVCFPVRDILMAANFYNANAMDGLRAAVRKFYYDENQSHLLSNNIYLRKEGGWKKIEEVSPV